MANQLTEKDRQLLDANLPTKVGLKPYEDGLWGSQGSKDFVHLQLFDENNNLIQFETVSTSQFEINPNNNNIEFYPGNHIRSLGYESGIFVVRYNFLRKLAGNENPVLVHTINKNDTKIGDVYTDTSKIYITDDAIVYSGTEQEYKDNPNDAEVLAVEDLKYIIDVISPSRTEVRLKAKNINGSYKDEFIDIQTAVIVKQVNNNISFLGGTVYDSVNISLTPENGGFVFTQKMIDGTITIPDVFQVNQIEVPVKANINAVKGGGGENVVLDNSGNPLNIANIREWDATLHDDAIRVENWSDGFNAFSGGTFAGTAHLGYHAKWVKEEGVAGGNCIKFTDQNASFIDLPEWPNDQRYRWLGISQKISSLNGKGVKDGDIASISFDIRSTVANKGVEISLRYANSLVQENIPLTAPAGFYDPNQPGPTEAQPTSPPEGYSQNSMASAQAIQTKPDETELQMLTTHSEMVSFQSYKKPAAPNFGLRDPQIGDNNASTTLPNQTAAWKIGNIFDDGDVVYQWIPDLEEDLKIGTKSLGEEWEWDGYSWLVSPSLANFPPPPPNTVNNLNAVNHHPYVPKTQGVYSSNDAYYPRENFPGENNGWQTATVVGNNATALLFKDDLIWKQKHDYTNNNLSKFDFYTFDEYFPAHIYTPTEEEQETFNPFEAAILANSIGRGIRDVIVDVDTNKKLYDDIFEKGFIQSVTRGPNNDGTVRSGLYLVFYNNGDVGGDGIPTEDSNKYFYVHRNYGVLDTYNDGVLVQFLKDINGGLNQKVIDNELKLEWFFKKDGSKFKYYIHVGEEYYSIKDADRKIKEQDITGPDDVSDGFPGSENADAILGKVGGFGRYRYIIGDRQLRSKSNTGDGTDRDKDINDKFYRCGEYISKDTPVTYGVRNISATNYGVQNEDGEVINSEEEPVYDNDNGIYNFENNPTQEGTLSPLGVWKWSGNLDTGWVTNALTPPRYNYTSPGITKAWVSPEVAGEWVNVSAEIPIPSDWELGQDWFLYIYGDGSHTNAENASAYRQQGIVWVDNVSIDFILKDQSETIPVYKPYSAQIKSTNNDGTLITVDKTIREAALEVGANDDFENGGEGDGNPDIYNLTENFNFENFKVTYTNLNPKDLRTYLKFENNLFLTTNFKSDRVSVSQFPYSIVYKLYEPLPASYEKFDECIVVKEMANPLEEKVRIIDFVNEEEPSLVLRSPDLDNVESPVQRRETQFKTEADILTSDTTVSSALRNEFLSQSLDSVEINTDYSKYENFVNFGSAEVRIRNFKTKLENIEQYKIDSASYVGISGSAPDRNLYHHKIIDTKNKLDRFENYMYFKSSSYVSSSIGIFHDNAWPKASGEGTVNSPYVLAHTTSSQADTWFANAVNSASLYDLENNSKLSDILPEHIKIDTKNDTYLRFTDMIGQHFDGIWEYINAVTDVTDRRDRLDEGISKDLLYSVAKSLGWNLNDGKDLLSLSRYALGKEVTGSAYSDYSATSERDVSREIWSRIINNMPFFLKNKGTVRALKGLINVYGIPSTILRVKEYGGPALSDDASPQFEITRKFTKALDFKGAQSVKVAWADDNQSLRKPDTVEFRFRAATGSNQILVEKQDNNNQDWFIRLKDNGSADNYGQVSFMLSGSAVGKDLGEFKEITSTSLPVYDGDFYSVMVNRTLGTSDTAVSQSYQLSVGKYDASRSKIHLYSTSTMDVTQAASSSFSNAWTGSGEIYIGGSGSLADVGAQFSGSIMEYRHWTEVLNTGSFKNHIANPKAYDGNTVSSSYSNLVLRYSFDDNKDLTSDTEGIRDVSSNQTQTLSGSHSGFTGNFFRSVVDELKTHIPSIGGLKRTTDKIRIESNNLKPGFTLSSEHRATNSAYDTAPSDSNKVGIWFAPTDVINNDIINSVGNLNFEDYLGDPRDKKELSYRGLNYVADNYWKKYTAPNNFWDYMRMIKYYDQSLYPQLRKLIPARAKPDIGLLIEPNIFERPKVVVGKTPDLENTFYSSSIDVTKDIINVTSSFNAGLPITNYDAYTGDIDIYSYTTGSSVVSSSGENLLFEASSSEARDIFIERSIWQRLNDNDEFYSNVTMSFGDTLNGVKGGKQVFVSGSRVYGINEKTSNFYTSSADALIFNENSSSFHNTDLDNFSHLTQGLRNSFYIGVKNTKKTTSDSNSPVEVIISAPTKLVTTDQGGSSLDTGDGIVPDFKEGDDKDEKVLSKTYEELQIKNKGKKFGLKSLSKTLESDMDRIKKNKKKKIKKLADEGKLILEKTPDDKQIKFENVSKSVEELMEVENDKILKEQVDKLKEDGILDEKQIEKLVDDGVLKNEK